ncbi:uncharacterized protein LOC142333900 [Lycorma delicatula]|uniref:uncharacterized protein LOC142333900 n=1 Tax=Lycorma delicatula TaxID=130591 RepID=UPI003F5179DC
MTTLLYITDEMAENSDVDGNSDADDNLPINIYVDGSSNEVDEVQQSFVDESIVEGDVTDQLVERGPIIMTTSSLHHHHHLKMILVMKTFIRLKLAAVKTEFIHWMISSFRSSEGLGNFK